MAIRHMTLQLLSSIQQPTVDTKLGDNPNKEKRLAFNSNGQKRELERQKRNEFFKQDDE